MIERITPTKQSSATRRSFGIAAAVLICACPSVRAAELYSGAGVDIRWDNTLRYSAAVRVAHYDPAIVSDPNGDDGDRNFAPGLVSNRLDLLSVFDMTDGDFGFHASGAAWYDTVYHARTANDSPSTYNAASVPDTQFPRATRNLHGQYATLNDAFVFGNFELEGMPLSVRLGRQTLLWGESLFFAENGIAAGQAPVDSILNVSTPGSYSREVFLPVSQISLSLQPRPDVSINFYYQFEWRKSRLPAVGSYFSYYDFFDTGGERLIIAPGQYLYRDKDNHPPSLGQFGVALRARIDDFDFGLYALRFNAKDPELRLWPGDQADPSIGKVGTYELTYPTGIEVYGGSFSGYLGESSIAGEISARRHMPLVSLWPVAQYRGSVWSRTTTGGYASGDTLHAQVSSISTLGPAAIWDSADLSIEAAANELLNVTRYKIARDPMRDRFALSLRALLEPRFFQVLPNLDISVPLGFGYDAIGRSSVEEAQYVGAGDAEIGVAGTYRSIWRASVTYTAFFGSPRRQPFADRDFVLFTLERTF